MLYVGIVTSRKTGTRPFWRIGIDGRREARGARDHLVSRLQAPLAERLGGESRQSQEVCRRARIHEDRVSHAHPGGEGALELVGEAPRGQPEVERRIDEVPNLVRVEDLPADRHGRLAGDERRLRPLSGRVFLDERKYPLPKLVRRHVTGPRNVRYQATVEARPSASCAPEPIRGLSPPCCCRDTGPDLGARLVEDHRREVLATHGLEDLSGDLKNAERSARTEVEDATARLFTVQLLREREVGVDDVGHIEIVAGVEPVGPDDGRPALERRPDRPGNDPTPVQVAAAVDVSAAGDAHPEPVGFGVGLCQEVGAALRHVIGMAAVCRHLFRVGEDASLAVRLVARGHDDPTDEVRVPPADLQELIGTANVGFERREGASERCAHQGLRAEVKDRVRLVLDDRPLEIFGGLEAAEMTVQRAIVPLRTSSDCGSASRMRTMTDAPARRRSGTSQDPTSPVAPVTRTRRPDQSVTARSSMGRARRTRAPPDAASRGACPSAARSPRAGRPSARRLDASVSRGSSSQSVWSVGIRSRTERSRTKNPPLIQPSPACDFSSKDATRSPSRLRPPKRAGGRTAVTVAGRPWER